MVELIDLPLIVPRVPGVEGYGGSQHDVLQQIPLFVGVGLIRPRQSAERRAEVGARLLRERILSGSRRWR